MPRVRLKQMKSIYPEFVLENVIWDFYNQKKYEDEKTFFEAVYKHHIEVEE